MNRALGHRVKLDAPPSIRMKPDQQFVMRKSEISGHLTPLEELDLMIANGYGDTPQHKLPSDWKTRPNTRGKAGW